MDTQNTIQRLKIIILSLILSVTLGLFMSVQTTITFADTIVSNADDGQLFPQGVADGKGGLIVFWEDYRTGIDWDVYAQYIDNTNVALWEPNGLPISLAANNQRRLRIIGYDTHAIVVWNDRRGRSSWDIYAQAIDFEGQVLWEKDGRPICVNTSDQSTQAIVSDGEGGTVVVWEDERRSAEFQDLYIQRVNALGEPMWDQDGIPVFPSESLQSEPILISNNVGGFYVVWWDVIGTDQWHIMAYRIGNDGKPFWDAPIIITPEEGIQGVHRVVPDSDGGIIVVWQIYENFINDQLYAQRISPDGSKLWQEEGVPICIADGIQKNPAIVEDGKGGAIVVWRDERDIYSDLYAQRVRADGTLVWKENGIPLCTEGGHQDRPYIVRTENDHFFVAWLDYRGDFGEKSVDAIYCQQIDLDGKLLWDDEGVPVSTSEGEHLPPFVVSIGDEKVSVIWSNSKQDSGDIYLKQFHR